MRRRARPSPSGPSSSPRPRGDALAAGFESSEPKTKDRMLLEEIPAAWLSGLLAASSDLPIEDGPEAVVASLLEALTSIAPDLAFGVSLDEGAKGGEWRFLRSDPDGSQVGLAPRAGRMFPELAHERSLPVKGAHEGIRFYFAASEAAPLREGTAIDQLAQRAADVLASALRTTRLVTAKGRESLELRGQIIQSEKLASLGQIAAGVVHELNNPLTSIIGYSDYLGAKAERERADPNDVERLHRIREAAGRILKFSRDLIAYARPSIEPPAPVSVEAVVDQALVFCEHVTGRAGIRVERKIAADLGPVLGVRDQLIQVFVNLFTNACHAMELRGGTLKIKAESNAQRRTVKISVVDTGHGIGPENLKRIFEPFFTTKTEGRGTGLGLSIVRNIVLVHGGAIAVDSTPRKGTSFVLELPVAP